MANESKTDEHYKTMLYNLVSAINNLQLDDPWGCRESAVTNYHKCLKMARDAIEIKK